MKLEEIQNIAFEMIGAAGLARQLYQQAIDKAKKGAFEEAKELLRQGNQQLTEGSRKHFAIIQEEADGLEQPNSVLFMHAEDQLMMSEIMRDNTMQLIDVYQELEKKENK